MTCKPLTVCIAVIVACGWPVIEPLRAQAPASASMPSSAVQNGSFEAVDASGKVYWPVTDGQGNVVGIVDGTGAPTLVASFEYGPFGELLVSDSAAGTGWSDPTAYCPFLFSTKYYDAEVGLYYYGYRYLDPTAGKWLNRDPLAEEGGLNLYGFCKNDPGNAVDPIGGEEIYIEGGKVKWVVQKRGLFSNSDVSWIEIGTLAGSGVRISPGFGGGVVSLDSLKEAAGSFWNVPKGWAGEASIGGFPNQSDLPQQSQVKNIRRVLELMRGGAACRTDHVLWAAAKELGADLANNADRRAAACIEGIGEGAVDAAKGTWNSLAHPIDTLDQLGKLIDDPGLAVEAAEIYAEEYAAAAGNDDVKFSKMTGKMAGELMFAIGSTKGLDKAAKLLKIREIVRARLGGRAPMRGAGTYENLVNDARLAYPNKAGIEELHHITPKYLGGAADGPLAPLDAAYHQQITNEFRSLYPYAQPQPGPVPLQQIMNDVYMKYPLPPGTSH